MKIISAFFFPCILIYFLSLVLREGKGNHSTPIYYAPFSILFYFLSFHTWIRKTGQPIIIVFCGIMDQSHPRDFVLFGGRGWRKGGQNVLYILRNFCGTFVKICFWSRHAWYISWGIKINKIKKCFFCLFSFCIVFTSLFIALFSHPFFSF